MSDKDYNESFQKKFEAYSVEPSAAVWKGIVSELDKEIPKKSYRFSWLAAAASVLIIISVGLWLYSPEKQIKLQGKADNIVVAADPEPSESTVQELVVKPESLEAPANIKVSYREYTTPKQIEKQPEQVPVITEISVSNVKPSERIISPEVELNKIIEPNRAQPVLAFAEEKASANDEVKSTAPRRLKTLMDVVNYAVEKVDPRPDKIIEFRSDGDGGSQISGINLGLLKIKGRNK